MATVPGAFSIGIAEPVQVIIISFAFVSCRSFHPAFSSLDLFPLIYFPLAALLSRFPTEALESQSTSAANSSGCPFFSNFESKNPSRYPLTIRSSKSEVEIAGVLLVGTNRPIHHVNKDTTGIRDCVTHPTSWRKRKRHPTPC